MGRFGRPGLPQYGRRRRQPQRRRRQPHPAFARQPADAVRRPGRRRQGAGVPGRPQRADRRHRRPGQQPHDVPARVRRGIRPRRPVHQHRRRQLRRVEGLALQQQHSAQLLVQRALAADRRRRRPAAGRARGHLSQRAEPVDLVPVQLQHPAQHLGRQRRVLGQDAVVHPGGLQRGQDHRRQAQQRPARHRLGQRADRARRAGRLQDAEHDDRGRLQQQAVRLQDRLPRLEVHRQQRLVPVDELLHAQRPRHDAAAARQRPQEVELQRVHQAAALGLGDHRALHAEHAGEQLRHRGLGPEADGQRGNDRQSGDPAGRGLSAHAAVRLGRGLDDQPRGLEPVELRRQHQEDVGERRVEREPDGAARHPRLLQLLRPGQPVDRRVVPGGQPGHATARPRP